MAQRRFVLEMIKEFKETEKLKKAQRNHFRPVRIV